MRRENYIELDSFMVAVEFSYTYDAPDSSVGYGGGYDVEVEQIYELDENNEYTIKVYDDYQIDTVFAIKHEIEAILEERN